MTTIYFPAFSPGARSGAPTRSRATRRPADPAVGAPAAAVTSGPRPSPHQRFASLVGTLLMIWSRPRKNDDDDAASVTPGSGTPSGPSGDPGAPGETSRAGLPTLDLHVLDNLGVELSSHAGALLFAGTFVDMLPQRIGAVEAALTDRDADAAVVALLSLHVSSSMVGARRLEEESSAALELIDEPTEHRALVGRLRQHGADVASMLAGIMHQDARSR